jgi:hypothetical protein
MRSASGALVGDGGGTGGLGGAAACVVGLSSNDATETVGVMANALPSVRSTPGPAANTMGPSTQQLWQLPTRRASDGASGDALARLAVGWVDATAP